MRVSKIQHWWYGSGGGIPIDADAQALITAAGVTDPLEQGYINTLFVNLKAGNVYSDLGVIWLTLGLTAASQKWNAVNPLDTDAAYRLTWAADTVGAHTRADGYLPNGTTQYADTKFIHSAFNGGINKQGMFIYSKNTPATVTVPLGVTNTGQSTTQALDRNTANPTWYVNNKNADMTGIPASGLAGLFLQGPATGTQVGSAQPYIGQTQIHYRSHFGGPVPVLTTISNFLGARNTNGAASIFSSADIGLAGFTKMMLPESVYTLFKELSRFLNSYRTAGITLKTNVAFWFGDSVTQGQVAQNLSVTSVKYTTLASAALGFTEWNCGLGGTTLQSGLTPTTTYGPSGRERINQIPVKTSNESYLFFAYGINDIYLAATEGSAANFKTQFTEIVQHAINVKGWPANKIVLLSCPPIQLGAPHTANQLLYESKISEVCSERGCQYIDIHTWMDANGGAALMQVDGIHPNDAGLQQMSNCIVANIV